MTIESALSQTFCDIEVVVVDDGSTDNIESVIESFTDERLFFLKNNENIGQFGNFNRCIKVARGEFIHILHSDDTIDSHFIEQCVRFFDGNPTVGLTFTSAVFHNGIEKKEVYFSYADLVIPAPIGFQKLLRMGCFIPCPSVIVRKSVYDVIGSFSLDYSYAGDYYQWLKISRIFNIGFVKNAIVHYHEGEQSETHKLTVISPAGYIDRLRIIISIISDLKSDYSHFVPDINHFLQILTIKYLIIACTWHSAVICYHQNMLSPLLPD